MTTPTHLPPLVRQLASQTTTWAQTNSQILALILTGSFARKEGTIIQQKDRTQIENDLDFVIITPHPLPKTTIHQWSRQLSQQLSVKIDLLAIPQNHLPHLPPHQIWFDAFNSGLLLWKHPHATFPLPHWSPSQVTPFSAITTLKNRLISFLEIVTFRPPALKPLNRLRFNHQLAKTIFALTDAHLILAHQYRSSYQDKLSRFSHLFPHSPLLPLVQLATQTKLHQRQPFTINHWYQTKSLYLQTLCSSWARVYHVPPIPWPLFFFFHRHWQLFLPYLWISHPSPQFLRYPHRWSSPDTDLLQLLITPPHSSFWESTRRHFTNLWYQRQP